MSVNEKELENLIERSGVGSRTARKLREANKGTTTTGAAGSKSSGEKAKRSPKGHGAPSEDRTPVQSF